MTESITQRELDGGEIQSITNFEDEVAKGNVKNHSQVSFRGANDSVGSTLEDLSSDGLNYVWPQAAVNLEAISDDADDTALGLGTQSIIITGLDGNWDAIFEVVAMNGLSPSAPTTKQFLRINNVVVFDNGTYGGTLDGGNQGTITVRTSGAGQTHATIVNNGNFGFSVSTSGRYTVANNFGFLVNQLIMSVDSKKIGRILVQTRRNNMDFDPPFFGVLTSPAFSSDVGLTFALNTPILLEERTDIWLSAASDDQNTSMIGFISGILYKFRT